MPTPAYLRAASAAAQLSGSRRHGNRWEFKRELRFSYRRGDREFLGSGRTRDMSEQGVRFENDHQIPEGSEIELRISWPVLLQNVCLLELVIRGPLVRSDRNGTVVHVNFCEFQTCGDKSFGDEACRISCSLVG